MTLRGLFSAIGCAASPSIREARMLPGLDSTDECVGRYARWRSPRLGKHVYYRVEYCFVPLPDQRPYNRSPLPCVMQ